MHRGEASLWSGKNRHVIIPLPHLHSSREAGIASLKTLDALSYVLKQRGD